MSSHEQEYGQYYGTKHNPTGEFHQISSSADKQSSGLMDSLGLNIVFLEKKYKEDLNMSK